MATTKKRTTKRATTKKRTTKKRSILNLFSFSKKRKTTKKKTAAKKKKKTAVTKPAKEFSSAVKTNAQYEGKR